MPLVRSLVPARLRRPAAIALILALHACSSGSVQRPSEVPETIAEPIHRSRVQPATIVRVYDADSIEVRLPDGTTPDVRLIGLDAPDGGIPFSGTANRFARRLLPVEREVFVEEDDRRWDRRGRYLVYLWLSEPTDARRHATTQMFNAMLLREGLAHVQPEAPNLRYASLFRWLQRKAREAGRGIWV